jgi:hypothetical protein
MGGVVTENDETRNRGDAGLGEEESAILCWLKAATGR